MLLIRPYEASDSISDVTQLLRDVEDVSNLKDFVHQYYGKCLVEMNRPLEALEHFSKAKVLRLNKPDADLLIASTEDAIFATHILMKHR